MISDIVLISDDVQGEEDSDDRESILFPVSLAKRYSQLRKDLNLHLQVKIRKQMVLVARKGRVACFNTSYRVSGKQ